MRIDTVSFDKMKTVLTISAVLVLITGCTLFRQKNPVLPIGGEERLTRQIEKTNWLVAASILGIGLSLVGYVNGNKGALSSLVGCAAVLILTLVVARFATWLAVLGGLAVIAGAVAFVYSLAVDRGLWRPLVKKPE